MGIALFHLLPESSESFDDYYTENASNSVWKNTPIGFFIAFGSYSLILLFEKVAFDSHSLTSHTHTKKEETKAVQHFNSTENLAHPLLVMEDKEKEKECYHKADTSKQLPIVSDERRGSKETEISTNQLGVNPLCHKNSLQNFLCKPTYKTSIGEELMNNNEPDEDEDEMTLRNVVSSKGKFASYLHARNIMASKDCVVPDRSLLQASRILERAVARKRAKSIDETCQHPTLNVISPKKPSLNDEEVHDHIHHDHDHDHHHDHHHEEGHPHHKGHVEGDEFVHHFNPTSNLTPYILLVALSIHGLFEGTALGVQTELKDSLFLAVAIIAHKWAEAFALGISFSKSNTNKGTFIRMIILFAIFTPTGILIGMLLAGGDKFIQGVFLGISAGTFLYVSASEVIVEEFAITKYRYQKYTLYLLGGILVGILAYMEALNEIED